MRTAVRPPAITRVLLGAWCTLVALASAPGAGAEDASGFTVSTYAVKGDNPLGAAEADRILTPFKGVKHGLDDLATAAKALEQALRARGYIFHKVVLPAQTIEHETVELQIQTLTVATVSVVGNQHFSENNVRHALPGLQDGTTPDIKSLARTLALANDHPDRHMTLNLKEGSKSDSVDAEIAVQDRRPWALFGNFSNLGSPDVGRSRLALGAQHDNLFGFDDALTFIYTTSPEATADVKQVAVNYHVPTYRLNGVSTAYFVHSDVNSGRIQNVFDVSGAGDFFGYAYSQYLPLIGNYRHQLGAGIDDRLFNLSVAFFGTTHQNDVRSRPFTVRYQGEYRSTLLLANFNLSYALNTGNGANNNRASYNQARAGADPEWDAFRYDFHVTANLPLNWQAVGIFEGQIAGEPLIPGEQFGVGGVSSVRGFEERGVTGDSGQRLTLEMWLPPFPHDLRLLGFADVGHVVRRHAQVGEVEDEVIASTGVGLRWQWRQQVALAVDYGHELQDATARNAGGTKWHLSLTYRY